MLNLAEYRNRPATLADFLPWAALAEEGVVLNKSQELGVARLRNQFLPY